jgi:hypothetical protein
MRINLEILDLAYCKGRSQSCGRFDYTHISNISSYCLSKKPDFNCRLHAMVENSRHKKLHGKKEQMLAKAMLNSENLQGKNESYIMVIISTV